jgi:hypothetical protein
LASWHRVGERTHEPQHKAAESRKNGSQKACQETTANVGIAACRSG